jgi:hypothetical protein
MTREERIAQATTLRQQGLNNLEIAKRLGVARSTINRCFSERSHQTTLRTSREAKRRRTGACEDCGTPTSYNGHRTNGPSRYCHSCSVIRSGVKQRGTKFGGEVLAYLSEPRRFAEIRDHFGITNSYLSQMLYGRLLKYGMVTRLERGVYQRTDAL